MAHRSASGMCIERCRRHGRMMTPGVYMGCVYRGVHSGGRYWPLLAVIDSAYAVIDSAYAVIDSACVIIPAVCHYSSGVCHYSSMFIYFLIIPVRSLQGSLLVRHMGTEKRCALFHALHVYVLHVLRF